MKNLLFLLFSAFFFISCQSKKTESQTTSDLKIENIAFQKSSKPIISAEGDTTISNVSISYPKLSGGDVGVNAKINKYLEEYAIEGINGMLNPEGDSTRAMINQLDKAAEAFIALPQKEHQENNEYPMMGYSYELAIDTLFISPKVISFYASDFMFTGGAHGNYGIGLLNFDAKTGDLLKLNDFVKDSVALTKLAEVKFIAEEKKNAKENGYEFTMEDYFFENKKFVLPDNIGFTDKGLRFIFNPYEAAAYARGQIIFELSSQELAGILTEKYK